MELGHVTKDSGAEKLKALYCRISVVNAVGAAREAGKQHSPLFGSRAVCELSPMAELGRGI
jgi:hypothetical protein